MAVKVEKNNYFSIKKTLIAVWDEFVYGGHLLAFGDAVALYVMAVILNIPVSWDFLVMIYLCVFAANLINRSDEYDNDKLTNPVRVKTMEKYIKLFYPIVIICLASSVFLLLYFSGVKALIFAIFIFLISFLYTFILKSFTRYLLGFKNYIAALFYSLTVFLLVIYYDASLTIAVILIFIFYYLRIFLSSAVCDFKDVEEDNSKGLKTLAIRLGRRKSVFLFDIINIFSGVLIIYGVYKQLLPAFSLGILLTIPFALYYTHFNPSKKNKEFFFNVIIDGEFVFWLPYIIIGKAILG